MPLVIAPLVALAVGMFLGLRNAGSLGARGGAVAERCMVWLALLGFFPVLAFGGLYQPGWAFLHIVDASRIPSFVALLVAAFASSLVVVGHRAGRTLGTMPNQDGSRVPLGILAAAIPLAFSVIVLGALHARVLVVEPARRAAEAVSLFGSRFGIGLALMDLLLAAAVWLTFRELEALEDAERDRSERMGRTHTRLTHPRRSPPPGGPAAPRGPRGAAGARS
ncbi:MAG: hypothetical protein HOW73_03310 [Polyangiaceae bacterium]|nr:hypothetical protein [Polyangiaceae bacterium]